MTTPPLPGHLPPLVGSPHGQDILQSEGSISCDTEIMNEYPHGLDQPRLDDVSKQIYSFTKHSLCLLRNLRRIRHNVGTLKQRTGSDMLQVIHASGDAYHYCNTYTEMLWAARKHATSLAGPRGVRGFVKMVNGRLSSGPPMEHEAIISQATHFLENLTSTQAMKPDSNFELLLQQLNQVKSALKSTDIESEARYLDDRIKQLAQECGRARRHLMVYVAVLFGILGIGPLVQMMSGSWLRSLLFGSLAITPTIFGILLKYREMRDAGSKLVEAKSPTLDIGLQDLLNETLKMIEQAQSQLALVKSGLRVLDGVRATVAYDSGVYLDLVRRPQIAHADVTAWRFRNLLPSVELYEQLGACLPRFANTVAWPL